MSTAAGLLRLSLAIDSARTTQKRPQMPHATTNTVDATTKRACAPRSRKSQPRLMASRSCSPRGTPSSFS